MDHSVVASFFGILASFVTIGGTIDVLTAKFRNARKEPVKPDYYNVISVFIINFMIRLFLVNLFHIDISEIAF